eukprot:4728759-Alexandrium_andersonii.AAC.1
MADESMAVDIAMCEEEAARLHAFQQEVGLAATEAPRDSSLDEAAVLAMALWKEKSAQACVALRFFKDPATETGANKTISLILVHDHALETSSLQWVFWDDFKRCICQKAKLRRRCCSEIWSPRPQTAPECRT